MLEALDLRRSFGAVTALDGLTFTVPRGQVVGFLGPNGAGKTTAMRTIVGISEPDGGEVRWDGRPVGPTERFRFGYLPEERGLYPGMAIGEQLSFFGRLHGMAKADAGTAGHGWLEQFGLADRAGDKLETLSLGNQQRVQLACALIHRPELLVLDEPFSGLDPVAIDTLGLTMAEVAATGVAVLFSSHQLDLVEDVCEAVVIVNRGRVVVTGRVDDLARGGERRFEVVVEGDAAGAWAAGLDGAHVVDTTGGHVRLVLDEGTDPQLVLRAAQAAGPVTHFVQARRRLSEVFREAVAG